MKTVRAIPSKRCPGCHEEKPLDDYGHDRTKWDGRNGRCRECRRVGEGHAQTDTSCTPQGPPGSCIRWRDGCRMPAMEGHIVCSCHAAYYATGSNPGIGETPEEKRTSRIRLARLALERFPDEVVA